MRLSAIFPLSVLTVQTGFAYSPPSGEGTGVPRPNIVVILADDLASHELGCYGGKNVPTPHIDRIAREGVRFTHCFASTSMSCPIRASLYTGLYPVRSGTYKNHQTSRSDIKSVTDYLPENGYPVWLTGKIHNTPRSVYQFDMIPGFEKDCTSETADYFTDSLELRIRNVSGPFCLFVCSTLPHAPWTVGDRSSIDPDKLILPPLLPDSKEFREVYRTYLAEVKALDEQVGVIWKMLEETGQLDNTLLLFLGEQGAQFPGGKWTCWNYGVSSAMIARYPAKIKPGSVSDVLVQYEDILPTLVEFTGGIPSGVTTGNSSLPAKENDRTTFDATPSLPAKENDRPTFDGISFLPALFGKKVEHRPWAYGNHNNVPEGSAYPIRSIRDKRYHLIVNLTPEATYLEKHVMNSYVWTLWTQGDDHALTMANRYLHRPAIEFYDTKNDPWELNNLASDRRYAEKIAVMRSSLDSWMEEQGDLGAAIDVPQFDAMKDKELQDKLSAIRTHDRAVLIKEGWLRDPYICIGSDGYYYLAGTPPHPEELHGDDIHFYHVPEGQTTASERQFNGVKIKIYLWRSPDLADWESFGLQYMLPESYWGQKHPEAFEKGSPKEWFAWTPQMYCEQGKWIFLHTSPSPYRNGADLTVSHGLINLSEYSFPMGDDMYNKRDPSLFRDNDGTWYLLYANTFIAPLQPGFTGLAAAPKQIGPNDRVCGFEGATLRKIGKKYVLFGTAWLTEEGEKGSYDLCYCTADNIYGPYSEQRTAGRFLGHGTPFQDREGRWWCTAFFNRDKQQTPRKPAQAINEQGITIVPLEVTILENGDVYIHAKDEAI